MQTLIQDLRYALRQLWKSPGFAIIAILTLAIGIGVNTAGFSIMDAVIFRPLAVPDLNHVVVVYEQKNHGDPQRVALANFADWQRLSRSFESLAVRLPDDLSLTGAGEPVHVQAERVSTNFFSVLRTDAYLGRVFEQNEARPGRDGVAVLGYAFWKSHFAADAGVLGKKIELNQHEYTIIGVMPKSMQYPSTADIFLPFAPTAENLADRSSHHYLVIGRLAKGVLIGQAQAELRLTADQLAKQYPATNQGWSVSNQTLLADMNGDQTPLYFNLVQGGTLFVLLVVCANIANLQFARGIARRPEIATRTALGASRGRLMRQLLTENILLGLIGGAGGVLVAYANMQISKALMPERVARFLAGWSNISLNGRALAFSLLLAVLAGLASGFAPALEALRVNLVDQLKSGSRAILGSRRSRGLRNSLAVAQISLAVALVIGAALMCKGMLGMLHLADPYQPSRTLTFDVQLPTARYDTPQKQAQWYSESLDRLRALPGVEHAETTQALPYTDYAWLDGFEIESRPVIPGADQSAFRIPVSAGYLGTMHVKMISGRGFLPGDSLGSVPVAIVSPNVVNRYFAGENPLGKRVRVGSGPANQSPWLTIVGVADEVNYSLWERVPQATIYMDGAQLPRPDMTYTIVANGDPMALVPAVRKTLASLDPALPLDSVMTYEKFMHERLTGMFYVAGMLGFDALIALLLAAVGIFGVMANLVGERTREIGVRLAMGARREDVLKMILRRAGWLTGTGVCVGLALAFALARGLSNLIRDVSPNDPAVFSTITGTVIAVALLASWLPARRASRIDPIVALRDE